MNNYYPLFAAVVAIACIYWVFSPLWSRDDE